MGELKVKQGVVKVVLCGDGAVGKSTILNRLTGKLHEETTMTPGVEVESLKIAGQDDDATGVFWDLGGQKQFRFIQNGFVRGAKLAILVYAVDFFPSFLDLNSWLNILPGPHVLDQVFLVANKIDLPNQAVYPDDGKTFARDHSMRFFEISAKTGENFTAFEKAVIAAIRALRGSDRGHSRERSRMSNFF